MRASTSLAVLIIAPLIGCSQTISLTDAQEKLAKCYADNNATPEGKMLVARLWQGDGTDTAAKLNDPKPLTPAERDALVQVHSRAVECRQIGTSYDNQHVAWETPIVQEWHQRSDQIFTKLADGEIPVGVANKLFIESNGRFQVDLSKADAKAVPVQDAQQQRAAEAMLKASARTTTTHCNWSANTLNCTGTR